MNWPQVKIGDVFETIRNGVSIKQASEKGGIPITRIETIASGRVDLARLGYADVLTDTYSDYYLRDGDILMSHINSWAHLGKTALVENLTINIIHGMNLLLLRADATQVLPAYAKHYFTSAPFKAKLHKISNQSVNQSSFAVTKLKELTISLPSLAAQQRIADTLDTADALRRKDQELLRKYDELAQSIFYEMFGDPVQNEKRWEVVAIRDLVREVKYGTSSPAATEGAFPYLRMNNITYGGELDLRDLKRIDASVAEYKKYGVQKDDLLFNRTNSKELVGKTAVVDVDQPMVAAGYLIRVRCNELANPYFISAYLNSKIGKTILRNMCKSIVGMANINAQELQDIAIIAPPRALQDEFAQKVHAVKHLKSLATKNGEYSKALFEAQLHRHF